MHELENVGGLAHEEDWMRETVANGPIDGEATVALRGQWQSHLGAAAGKGMGGLHEAVDGALVGKDYWIAAIDEWNYLCGKDIAHSV